MSMPQFCREEFFNIAQVLKQFIGPIGQCIVIIIERGLYQSLSVVLCCFNDGRLKAH